ncbi:PREDICTED: probable anion transporter 3, chloroplastic isoform X1 [Nelumbo nucifera]|uniref:Probable anion transporter 3, chloroplastic isoform X1 n=1 Tax=Nelumbo nucifera TaxID=4432 RepID=A0A1U8A5M5_NELNU|nr:PREDICTED: probable anion transporter 3, chloroplastic isoform X1 [Nelumbo nucifera]
MSLRLSFDQSVLLRSLNFQSPNRGREQFRNGLLSSRFLEKGECFKVFGSRSSPFTPLRGDAPALRLLSTRARVSRNDAQSFPSGSIFDENELQAPSFFEFITSERVKVVFMLGLALALCNADRVVMSVAIVPLSLAHGWSRSFGGVVQSSFLWGYLMSPIAGGALVDYYGGKVVMACGVTLWSLATFLTPWAAETSLWALLATRVLLGIAEGVALPSMNNMISRWFPLTERAQAVGLAMAGFQLGNVIGLTLSPILMSKGGVFGPFVIFGLSGFLWVLVWISATSSTPDHHPQISKFELEYILNTSKKSSMPSTVKNSKTSKLIPPFKRLLSKMPTWALISANVMHSWGYFVMLSWMPIYFNTIYRVDLRQAAWFSAVPWVMMAVLGYFSGVWSDMLIQNGKSVTFTRKVMQSIGFVGPGIALLGLNTAKNPTIATAWLTIAVGLKSFSHSGFLVNLQEIAPQYAGVLHGMSNTAGTLAAIIGTVGAGFFVELFGSFRGFLMFTAFLYFFSALFWDIFSTGNQVNFDETVLTEWNCTYWRLLNKSFLQEKVKVLRKIWECLRDTITRLEQMYSAESKQQHSYALEDKRMPFGFQEFIMLITVSPFSLVFFLDNCYGWSMKPMRISSICTVYKGKNCSFS